jgi:hypothetical protein
LEGAIRARLERAEGRKFGLTVGGAFLVLSAVLLWRGHSGAVLVTALLGSVLAAGGLLVPDRLGPVQAGWMAMAHAISRVTTPIFMSVVYFLVFLPTGVFRRAFGRNSLVRRDGEDTYWIDSPAGRKSNMNRQF